jgi:hypothetical protein
MPPARCCETTPWREDPTTSSVHAAVDTADAIFLDATLDRLADVLAERGDARCKDHRRAVALGVLATPALALSLLGVHTRRGLGPDHQVPEVTARMVRSSAPVAQVYVHVSDESLASGQGVARVERLGPVLVDQLARIVGHARIRVTPVVHLGDVEPAVDQYEIPDRVRQRVVLRDPWEAFPYSSRESRGLDLDHTNPYRTGQPGQTRPSNLGPLTRRAHRAKTHAGWQMIQTEPGVFWWRTGLGQIVRVGPDGTTDHTDTS